jgi:hypothetical protein
VDQRLDLLPLINVLLHLSDLRESKFTQAHSRRIAWWVDNG